MGVDITAEAYVFCAAIITGVFCGMIYDIFCVFGIFKKKRLFISLNDALLAILVCGLVMTVFYTFNSFQLRWHMFIGLFLGIIFYFLCIRCVFVFILKKILKIFHFILKILLTPTHFLYKILVVNLLRPICGFVMLHIRGFAVKIRKFEINRGNKKMEKSTKKSLKITSVIIAAAVLFMLVKGVMLQPQIIENHDKISELESRIEYEQQRAEEIDSLKENVDSDEYIEKIAREKLGMIRKDEIVFIDVTGEE